MAEGGIDRKAEERMEFTTSKDVTVAPTFTDVCSPAFNEDEMLITI